ncbi:hypothetical protein BHM03_00048831 [Ensete ventricosum]|uniref:Uncharacterized protein n=1 Tax=Ensete ventricosum TaxID=4639 RepID=A0A445MLG8_ENSVE|nr:hypothetical protein BHM03_00048831 [Ensete ventricosum]
MGGDEDKNTQEDEDRLGDHYVPSIELVNAHPPEVGPKALELIVNEGEATFILHPTRQQQPGAATDGRFHDDASSRH